MLASMGLLLREASTGGYALGAFNVYNLEGVRAVVSAAEAHQSPVMLQLHPGALQHGERLCDNFVGLLSFDIDHKTDTTGVVLEAWIIKALLGR